MSNTAVHIYILYRRTIFWLNTFLPVEISKRATTVPDSKILHYYTTTLLQYYYMYHHTVWLHEPNVRGSHMSGDERF